MKWNFQTTKMSFCLCWFFSIYAAYILKNFTLEEFVAACIISLEEIRNYRAQFIYLMQDTQNESQWCYCKVVSIQAEETQMYFHFSHLELAQIKYVSIG